ncbi:SLC13 family permease [Shewanella algae]|uniref:Transporter, divalent anion:Na+ symporter (DASS) family n=1 Tax=Shewanella algae TaxID=38313 RepID=A0A379YZG7_9GAMM|nr:SLC13 family permease [Shewanella algae]MBO2606509.1 SLC13 family permease [Shewanella algae]QHD52387.1 SLC13 family permease [Shewanella algae]TVL09485.1 potassium transporter TrkA [Shewanella algae]TVL58554.1 potassium transporter TrkA [Shewanella algae]SUI52438.1 transporter, divalent anion:Na+ symporter (DASS) family [Shewanella algae]
MSETWILGLILLALVAGLVSGLASPAMLFTIAALLSYLLGMLELESLLGSFTNASLVTLVLLVLATTALEKTPLLGRLSQVIGSGSLGLTMAKLGFSTALLSSFTNNTAVVASLIGVVRRNQQHAPAKLLLPLSYAAILGGTLTLIGTSTNLIVNSFVENAGLKPLGFFEFSLIGLAVVVAGIALLVLLSHLLPDGDEQHGDESLPYLLEAKVLPGSTLVGRSVQDNRLRALKKLYLAELERSGIRICPVPPQLVLAAGDVLRFSGAVESVELLHQFDGLEWFGKQQARGQNLVEAVLAPSSALVGSSLKASRFREQFDAAVMAIRRGHHPLKGGLGDIVLQAGDVLLLTPGDGFGRNPRLSTDFAAVSGLDLSVRLDSRRSQWVLAGFVLTIAASLLGWLPLAKGLVLLLLSYLALGAVTLGELKRRFPLELVLIVGSALSLANLMLDTGLAKGMADTLLGAFSGFGVFGAFVGVYLLTLLLTELITNNAAAALAFPVAYAIATSFGVDSRPFILAVVFGASASFISPYGYQTNLMVFNAGNYRFIDFVRLGLPLSLLYSAIVLFLVPMLFPFDAGL